MEGIGIALDLKGGRMFLTDLGGSVYSANLDGSNKKTVLAAEGNLTGIAYAEIPAAFVTFRHHKSCQQLKGEENELASFCFKTRERYLRKKGPDRLCDA